MGWEVQCDSSLDRECCGWCTLGVVLRFFNVLNKSSANSVNHMVNWPILTICYSFAIADYIEDEFTF